MAIALLMGARFVGGVLGFAVLLVVVSLLGAGFGGISMATAVTIRERDSVIGMNQLLVLPAMFLSTALLPAALLPSWIATVARFNPTNWAAVAAHEALLEASPDWSVVLMRLLFLAAFATVTTLMGTYSFRSYQRSI